ncbi:MAG: CoA transferase [Acidimicrobiales bacterium]|nr:CoA transferase [Acidimicrobiales bacterium]
MTGLLDGIRIVDFSQYLAGPSCTRLMVEQGAECIKLELPDHGDPSRGLQPRINRRSAFYVQQNRGKRSVCLDFRIDHGRTIAVDLVATADVVVENFSPGVMGRYGLSYDDLVPVKPDLIMASISGFGQSGPLADRPAFDFIAQGFSGIAHMTGFEDGPPLLVGSAIADSNAGIHAFGAIGAALFHRERTGEGSYLDISMVDALVHMHETGVHAPGLTDGEYVPIRHGRDYQPVAPAGVFAGPESWIILIVTVHQVDQLWDALGRPDLAEDLRFKGNTARVANRAELNRIIEGWMATFSTDDEVIEALLSHRVPCTKVNSPADLKDIPHLLERGSIVVHDDPVLGEAAFPGHPFTIAGVAPSVHGSVESLGQSNVDVLRSIGITPERIAQLEASQVLVSKAHG